MLHLKYVGETEKYAIAYKKISNHIVQITGDFPIRPNGFSLSRVDQDDNWDYTKFQTIYKTVDNGVQFSNDKTVYIPPVIPDTPEPQEPYVPTLEEAKENQKETVRYAYKMAKKVGVDVKLSTGTEHFPLTDEDITFLMGKQFELASNSGADISYQNSENRCKFYSNADMQAIIQMALLFVNYQTTYRNNLCEWIDECQSKEEVEQITYGMTIPEENQNEVYKIYLAKMEENK